MALSVLKARPLLSYPYLTDASGDGAALLTRINAAMPRGLPHEVRADACQALALAVLEGDIETEEIEAVALEFARRQYPCRKVISLDAPLSGRYTLLDRLTADDTLGAWATRGPYGDALSDCMGVEDLAKRLSDTWEANRLLSRQTKTYGEFSSCRRGESSASLTRGRVGMYFGVRHYRYSPGSGQARARDELAWAVEDYRARRLAEETMA
jgi:hypothetical protein